MFTGIVESTGIVRELSPLAQRPGGGSAAALMVSGGETLAELPLGASVAVNGVCLTVARQTPAGAGFDVVPETLQRTNFGDLRSGQRVNLERSLRAGAPLDGHVVQGHVDGIGVIERIDHAQTGWGVWLRTTPEIIRFVVPKGSIAIDGVSLTVVAVEAGSFSVALIPFTLERTTLGERRTGERVNLETDILARIAVARIEALLPDLVARSAGGGA